MSTIQQDLRYTKEHEWARDESGEWVVGLTDYAQGELGDVVYVELPEVGRQVKANFTFEKGKLTPAAVEKVMKELPKILEE